MATRSGRSSPLIIVSSAYSSSAVQRSLECLTDIGARGIWHRHPNLCDSAQESLLMETVRWSSSVTSFQEPLIKRTGYQEDVAGYTSAAMMVFSSNSPSVDRFSN